MGTLKKLETKKNPNSRLSADRRLSQINLDVDPNIIPTLRCPRCRRMSLIFLREKINPVCIWEGRGCEALPSSGGMAPWRQRLPGGGMAGKAVRKISKEEEREEVRKMMKREEEEGDSRK